MILTQKTVHVCVEEGNQVIDHNMSVQRLLKVCFSSELAGRHSVKVKQWH